ncbi:hypothetical protein E0Z10_g953 [Xylaria hypoxylon]|uniref:Ketoreductase (KR) domain-containing protein n=1 Tax=Xylaria hypoxylon TaxID=37992 RepID=A0A4Z0Z8G5_9PEZI|nr:hypothetical protein E0Z10_g953 [Xylaria hypoxylon]
MNSSFRCDPPPFFGVTPPFRYSGAESSREVIYREGFSCIETLSEARRYLPGSIARWLWSQLFTSLPRPAKSFKGQTVIITGANQGLSRNIDLCSYSTVEVFAELATRELERVDVLLENAGINGFEWGWSDDNERNLTVNVVSTFLLAFLVLPQMKETATRFSTQPRLTAVTSDTHYFINFEEKDAPEGTFNHMNKKDTFSSSGRYPTSKLIEVFVIREMTARRQQEGPPSHIQF